MIRLTKLGLSVISSLILLVILVSDTVWAAPTSVANLLTNPSFESGFTGGVASGWIKWSIATEPIYKQALSSTDATRVNDGSSSQQMEASSFEYVAGLQQTVSGLTTGKTYRFSAYAHAWASSDNVSTTSDGTITLKVGIGQGSTYAADTGIAWSPTKSYVNSYGVLSVEAVAQDTTLTVFTYADTTAPLVHNDTYWDNTSLVEVGATSSTEAAPSEPTAAAVQLIAPTDFPVPTPDDSGQIVYYVLPGDNLVHIATVACGETPECLAKIKELNGITGSGSIIIPGQKLILDNVAAANVSPTAEPTVEVTPDQVDAETNLVEEQPADAENDDVDTPSEAAESESQDLTSDTKDSDIIEVEKSGAICVILYDDLNGNGVLDPGESHVLGGEFALADMSTGEVLDGHTSTESESEAFCFSGLASGNYRITAGSPEGYTPTTRTDWDLTLAAGSTANLEFGSQLTGKSDQIDEVSNTASALRPAILGTVGVVLLLAAVGVAGYLVLIKRR